MCHRPCLSLILSCFALGGSVHPQQSLVPAVLEANAVLEAKWIAEEDDNICGIKDLKKVSNPAKVAYDELWDATPQIKKMKEKKIDPESAEGKALRSQAKTLITKKCEEVRAAKAHCGVWKAIKNEDKRTVPDVTKDVKDKLDE